jgi:hypothetical protein
VDWGQIGSTADADHLAARWRVGHVQLSAEER